MIVSLSSSLLMEPKLSEIVGGPMLQGGLGFSLRVWTLVLGSAIPLVGFQCRQEKGIQFWTKRLHGWSAGRLLRTFSSILQKGHRIGNFLVFTSTDGSVQSWGLGYCSHILTIRKLLTQKEKGRRERWGNWIAADTVVPLHEAALEPPYLHVPDEHVLMFMPTLLVFCYFQIKTS